MMRRGGFADSKEHCRHCRERPFSVRLHARRNALLHGMFWPTLLAGLLGGLGVWARFGLSAGIVSAVVLSYTLIRRKRAARACAPTPSSSCSAEPLSQARS